MHGELGDRLEWRLSPDGVPVAAILRFTADEVDGSGNQLPTVAAKLLVMKINAQGSCPVGAIPTKRPDANQAAREMADRVTPGTPCNHAIFNAVGFER